jgi:hypothetical protein
VVLPVLSFAIFLAVGVLSIDSYTYTVTLFILTGITAATLCRGVERRAARVAFISLIGTMAFTGYLSRRVFNSYFVLPKYCISEHAELSDLCGSKLSSYYVNAGGVRALAIEAGMYAQPPFDKSGIPIVDYSRMEIGRQYNPCTVAQYGLENLELFYRTRNPERRALFLKMADWLAANQKEGKWFCHFPLKDSGQTPTSFDAMMQGQGISVLLRAWQIGGKTEYLAITKRAFESMRKTLDEGGVSCKCDEGIWLEEYPNRAAPSHVLNGHIWALFGVWDMWRVTKDSAARELFDQGIAVLKADLDKYDTGYWVLYGQRGQSRPIDSAHLHCQIEQLKVLAALTHDPVFRDYAAKWAEYQKSFRSFCRLVPADALSCHRRRSTLVLMGIGAISLLAYAWRRRRRAG